ncbi:hypothetical protein [Salipiger thiooxidans]|uniref:hypothetical protein n=1 Tax=Salipiger thiooxidans TaxID=282683 RepID=UPI001CFACADB|nr:hypothetical protein [Salipiger thiooxidans]
MPHDGRQIPKLSPPDGSRAGRCIQVLLEPDDYRKFYEVVMNFGTSGAEAVRLMVRAQYASLQGEDV